MLYVLGRNTVNITEIFKYSRCFVVTVKRTLRINVLLLSYRVSFREQILLGARQDLFSPSKAGGRGFRRSLGLEQYSLRVLLNNN